MNDLNEVLIEGNLVRDPEITWVKNSDKAVCKFSIAVNRHYMDRNTKEYVEETSFFLVETWQSVAETCAKVLKKGRGVRVVGRLKQSHWEDVANGGKIREKIYIVAEHVEFRPQKKDAKEKPEIIKPVQPEDDNVDTTEAMNALDATAETDESIVEQA